MKLYEGGSSVFAFNGIDQNNSDIVHFDGLSVYPNPATDQVNITLEIDGTASMKLFNLEGKQMKQEVLNKAENAVDVSELDFGIYILHVRNGDHVMVSKISIQ